MSEQKAIAVVVETAVEIPVSKLGLKILINELTLQRRHLKMVQDQYSALMTCNRKLYASFHESHVTLQGELEVQNKLRLKQFGTRKIDDVIAPWPEIDRRNARLIIGEMKPMILEIRRISELNKVLLANQMKYIDFMLNLLVSTYRKSCMYGPQGLQTIDRGNHLFSRAA